MSIKMLLDARKHPARDAAIHSIKCIEKKDRAGWLSMWDEHSLLEDPVGKSPLDPEGNGHQGIEKITAFYDNIIAPSTLRFQIRHTYAGGNECANVGTITVKGAEGYVSRTELVMVYKVNDAGKVVSLRAFWEFDDMMAGVF